MKKAYKGLVITLPQDVQQLADILPRCPAELPVIVFTINGQDNESRDFQVRKQKVSDAVHWLIKHNPLYSHVTIDYQQIKKLPENGTLDHIPKVKNKMKTVSLKVKMTLIFKLIEVQQT